MIFVRSCKIFDSLQKLFRLPIDPYISERLQTGGCLKEKQVLKSVAIPQLVIASEQANLCRFLVNINNDFYLCKKVIAMLLWISYLSLLLSEIGV